MSKNSPFDPMTVGTAEDAADGVAVVVAHAADGTRHAAFMPRALEKLGQDGVIMASDIQRTVLSIQELQEKLTAQIEEARDMGMSWNSIGWCVGTIGDAARQRWGTNDRG